MKEKLLFLLSGFFLTVLVLGNVIGATKFVTVFGLAQLIVYSYLFKFIFAVLDTPLFYVAVWLLKPKVHDDRNELAWGYGPFAEEAL
ncbi:MAG: hypothetical protein ACE5GH_05545 [Fidelibacterota bacterium]